jgi:40-residue YVTN family beta-propeller repeat
VVFNPANGLVYVANANSASVSVCDPVTRSVVATIPVGNGPIGVDATPDGKRVYVACLSGQVYEIDAIGQVVTSIVDVGGSATAFGRFLAPAQACIGLPQTFKITISARPTLQPISDITVCSEQAVNVLFNSSPGATVQWTNTNPAIGLPENGTGNLQFMSASVVVPQTAVISATPALAGCTGALVSFVLTVVPGADTLLIDNSTCDPNLAGTFVQNLTNRFGCDSVVITTTLLLPSDTTILNQTTCNPNAAGTFVQTLTNQAGCDSLVVTIVAFDPNAADTTLITTTTCDPNAAGTFAQTLTNQAGCDSVVVTIVAFDPNAADTTLITTTTCDPNTAGTFVQTLANQAGCDSVVIINTVYDPNGCAPIALVSGRDPLCADRADGSFTLQAQSGLLPLTYTWSGPAGGSGSGQITALQTPATVVTCLRVRTP